MPTSIRLNEKAEQRLDRLARERGQTKSEFIREAISDYASRTKPLPDMTPYQKVEHLVGCFRGDPNLSKETGKHFTDLLRRKSKRASKSR